VSDQPDTYDVIVLGAGPVGENVVGRVVAGGLTAAVVEKRLAGGECSYYACIPSKALLRPMDLTAEVGRMPGLSLGPVDAAAVLARRDEAIGHLDDAGQVGWVESVPAAFLRGHGRLAGPRRVAVTGPDGGVRTLTARHAVVIATGSTPSVPDVPGLRAARPWTNREATTAREIPRRLVVVGGGVVACEMAQALRFLGAEETVMLVRGRRLLGRTEPFAGELVAASLRNAGIAVRFGESVARVERPAPGGPVTVHTTSGARLEADEILVATGREPAVHDIGLETVGLSPGGPLEVGDDLRVTAVPEGWLYAAGDVNGRNLLTHMGKYQARVCGDVIVARAKGLPEDAPGLRAVADALGAPQVIFTDPQVAAVGRTEEQARSEGRPVRVVEYDIGSVSGAYLLGDGYTGRAKAVVDEEHRILLGVTFVGPGVGELLHAATVAVTARIPLDRLWHAVPAFPTVSEIWLRLLEEYGL